MSIENICDLLETTYRTQEINQRVKNIYLGIVEHKIFEVLETYRKHINHWNDKTLYFFILRDYRDVLNTIQIIVGILIQNNTVLVQTIFINIFYVNRFN